jgi:Fe-S cluster assembly protein SufD
MNAAVQTPALERIECAHAAARTRFGGGPAWQSRRSDALARLLARGLPDRRDENWRYVDFADLQQRDFSAPAAAALSRAALEPLLLELPGAHRVILVNGRHAPDLSTAGGPAGLSIESLAAALARDPQGVAGALRVPGDHPDERFALLAEAFIEDGLVVRTEATAEAEPLVYLVHVAVGPAAATSHSRLLLTVGRGSRLKIVEHFLSLDDTPVLTNLACDVRVEDGAALDHVRLHQRGAAAAHVETLDIAQRADSRYRQQLFMLGGGLVRSGLHARLEGAGAEHQTSGLFMVDGSRQADIYTLIEHIAPHTKSEQLFHGVAVDRGRGAFNGRIIVHKGAQKTDSRQTSRNLILSPLAEINARPQLEILADDVKCSHGATVGSLDPNQLFYLLSRGLDPDTARGLLTFAFCEDVVVRVGLPALRRHIEQLVVGRLPDRHIIREFL